MLNPILTSIDTVGRWAGILAFSLVWGIAVLIVSEVVCRWLFSISLSFAWEYSAYFLATSTFCGAAYTMRTGGHVRVILFKGFLGPKVNYAMEIFATLVGAGVSIFLAYSLILFAWRSFDQGSVSPTINAVPLVIPQSAIAFGLFMLSLQMVARVLRLTLGLQPEDDAAKESFNIE